MKGRCAVSEKKPRRGRDVETIVRGAIIGVEKEPFGRNGHNGHTPDADVKTPYNWRDHVRSLHDLQEKPILRKPDIVQGIIPHGLTAVGGRPKAGKSALMLQIGLGVTGMLPSVLNRTPAHGRVLYLALEENERRLQARVRMMLDINGMDANLNQIPWSELFEYVTADDNWPDWQHGGLERITDYVKARPDTAIVMIDSAPLFRGPIPKQGGYDVDYSFTNGLAYWVNTTGVSLAVTWHTTKSKMTDDLEADPLAMLQNTSGVAAGLDTGLVMARKDGVMTLYRRGRDLDDDEPLKLRDSKETLLWTPDSTLGAVPARDAVLRALTVSTTPLKPKAIAELIGIPQATVRKAIQRLSEEASPLIDLCGAGYYLTARDESNQPKEGV